MRVYATSNVLSLQGAERSEHKTEIEQVINFLQEATDGLGLGHEAIDCFEVTRWEALITGQERDRNIRFDLLHASCSNTSIHFWHMVIEQHQVHGMRNESLYGFLAVGSG